MPNVNLMNINSSIISDSEYQRLKVLTKFDNKCNQLNTTYKCKQHIKNNYNFLSPTLCNLSIDCKMHCVSIVETLKILLHTKKIFIVRLQVIILIVVMTIL